MKELYSYQAELLKNTSNKFVRFLADKIEWDERMIAIKGPRGTGKTTLLLQRLKYHIPDNSKALYVNVEHPWFFKNTLFDTAEEFHINGGELLFIDEIHKYEHWSRELKVIYDGFPNIKIVFSASSALEIYKGESDLSRRVITYELPGLSFREFLKLKYKINFPVLKVSEVIGNHQELSNKITEELSVIPKYKEYLMVGYFPIINTIRPSLYPVYVFNTLNAVLEQDVKITQNLTVSALFKLKKLLGILAQSVPFEPNISNIAQKSGVGRNTVLQFLHLLEKARVINFLNRDQFGISVLQKPDKILIENTNLMYAIDSSPNYGTLRETFFLSQIKNAGIKVQFPDIGDFIINQEHIIEVGGKNKKVKNKDLIIAMDDINTGYKNTIPLWLWGFLY